MSAIPEKKKVLAYILREDSNKSSHQVLVFDHRGEPEAGVQVPGGTVDPGEDLEEAMLREVFEESGLSFSNIEKFLGRTLYFHPVSKENHHRHFYLIQPQKTLPESWSHQVSGDGEDQGLFFEYYWMDLETAKTHLVADMGSMLDQI